MKKQLIYGILVSVILLMSFSRVSYAVDSPIDWHSSLAVDTEIAWRITDMYLVDVNDPPEIGNQSFRKDDMIKFIINDTLPATYEEAYLSSGPPTFIQLFVGWDEVSFYDVKEDPGFALQFLILPMLFYEYDGPAKNITEFLDFRQAENPNITTITYTVAGDYIHADITNDLLTDFQLTINNNTGIVRNLYVADDFGHFDAELNIYDSDIDDYGIVINNELTWHASLVAGTVLSYEFTVMDFDDPSGYLEIGSFNATLGDIFKFKYILALPIDPLDYYGGDTSGFQEVYFNNELQDLTTSNPAQRVLYANIVNPLTFIVYNGTIFSMETVQLVRHEMDPQITAMSISYDGDYMLISLTIEWDEYHDEYSSMMSSTGNENYYHSVVDYDLRINTLTGILKTLSFDIESLGNFEMELNIDQSSIDDYGVVNTDFTESTDTPTFSLPGFTWLLSSILLIVIVPIYKKKKK